MFEQYKSQVPALDCAAEASRIQAMMAHTVSRVLLRRGLVLGVSGGVDSALCVSLAARAVGPDRVFALMMPEKDHGGDDQARAIDLCRSLGIEYEIQDITSALAGLGCYRRRDAAIKRLFPEYEPGCLHKIVLARSPLDSDAFASFDLVVRWPSGQELRRRMPADVYREVVAATNLKQRARKTVEYLHAERLNYAVLGTPNRLEYELGFFVRGGDGLADLKPIAHLYKTQVYALAEYLGVPQTITSQPPSTGTYSLSQTQDEFYFGLPLGQVDYLLYAYNAAMPIEAVAGRLGLDIQAIRRVYRDMEGKRRVAVRTLREAILVEPVGQDAAE